MEPTYQDTAMIPVVPSQNACQAAKDTLFSLTSASLTGFSAPLPNFDFNDDQFSVPQTDLTFDDQAFFELADYLSLKNITPVGTFLAEVPAQQEEFFASIPTDFQVPEQLPMIELSLLTELPAVSLQTEAPTPVATKAVPAPPLKKRRPKVPVAPEIKRTEKYLERRKKNNLAAARNRQMKLMQAQMDRLPGLNQHNNFLRHQCEQLRAELANLCLTVQMRLTDQALSLNFLEF